MKALGKLSIIDLHECDYNSINDQYFLEETLNRLAADCGATIISSTFHAFAPQGITGILAISESHISIHTWPEYNYATVDVFCCNGSIDVARLANLLQQQLSAERFMINQIDRGIIQKELT